MVKKLWYIKYRPTKLDEFIFQNEQQEKLVNKFIADKSIPHLLFTGHRGTGKTALALLLKNLLEIDDCDFLALNASDDNSVDTIRYKIKNFVSTSAIGEFKVVFLDEADYMTGPAQAILRNLLEEYEENARFIFTANYPKKIIPEIKSRCQELVFKSLDKNSLTEKAYLILKAEGIKVDDLTLLDKYVDLTYPDCRKLIGLLAQNSVNGVLQEPTENSASVEYKLQILDLLENDKWEEMRQIVCDNVDGDGWEELYRFLYDYLHEVGKFKKFKDKWNRGVIIIADHLYKHAVCADSEINFAACAIRLSEV